MQSQSQKDEPSMQHKLWICQTNCSNLSNVEPKQWQTRHINAAHIGHVRWPCTSVLPNEDKADVIQSNTNTHTPPLPVKNHHQRQKKKKEKKIWVCWIKIQRLPLHVSHFERRRGYWSLGRESVRLLTALGSSAQAEPREDVIPRAWLEAFHWETQVRL